MISSFHNRFLEHLTMYRAKEKYLLAASILSYYLYDPGSLLANITRRKLKLSRVSNVDEGFRILMNLSLNASFRSEMSSVFLEVISKTEVVSELINLARDGAIKIILNALEDYYSENKGNPALNYALNEIRRIVKTNKISIKHFKPTKLKAIITMIFTSPTHPATILGKIGTSLGRHEIGAELWEIDLKEEVLKDVEFLIYALDASEISEDIISNLLNKSKIVLLLYDKPFSRHYRGIENFFLIFRNYLSRAICLGIYTDDPDALDVPREILEKFPETNMYSSNKINDLLYNSTVSLLKYLEKKK